MDRMIAAIIRAITAAGMHAVKAFPQGGMPALTKPCTAVGLLRAKGAERTGFSYLGVQETADGTRTPLYGKSLEAEIYLQLFCPRALGASACMQEAERLAAVLAAPIAGVRLGAFTVEACRYDAVSDCYQCRLCAQASGYLYASADEDETEFTDFILKGEVK